MDKDYKALYEMAMRDLRELEQENKQTQEMFFLVLKAYLEKNLEQMKDRIERWEDVNK